jgi:hypothetical protein
LRQAAAPGLLSLAHAVARFEHDTTYLERVRAGGLASLNSLMAELLRLLCDEAASRLQTEQLAGQLNDVLRRAIYLLPHLAAGVRVEIVRRDADFAERVERYIGRGRTRRGELFHLWSDGGSTREGTRDVLSLPLPYLFATDSETAQRRARRESWEDLAVLPSRWMQREDVRGGTAAKQASMQVRLPPLLLVRTALDRELGHSRVAILMLDEVKRIALIPGGPEAPSDDADPRYLPAFSSTIADKLARPRPGRAMHYLIFRDFGDIGHNRALAGALDIPSLANRSLLEPEYGTGLLDVGDDDASRQWLERGVAYLAVTGAAHASPLLFRFEGVEIRYDERTLRTLKHSPLQRSLYQAAFNAADPLRRRAKLFAGAGLMAELMQVPVAPRRFYER